MQINALFVTRHGEPLIPELVDAWDEFCIDGNPDGYEDAVRKLRAEVGTGDVKAFAVVTFEVPDQAVLDALYPEPVTVSAEVVAS